MRALPCPHGDAVCSRARREPKQFLDPGLCIDCRIDHSPSIGREPAPVDGPALVAHVEGVDVEVVA